MLCKKRSELAFAPAEICKTTNSCPRGRFCVLPTFFFKIRPSDLTSRNWHDILIAVDGALAQLVAHNTGSVGVRSSNLLCSTKPKKSELNPSWGWVRISSFYGIKRLYAPTARRSRDWGSSCRRTSRACYRNLCKVPDTQKNHPFRGDFQPGD